MKNEQPKDWLKYTGMAVKMAIVILAGVFGGIKLDEISGNETPVYTLILSLLSVGIAIYIVIKDASR